MNKKIEAFFYWTRRERSGVVIMMTIIIAIWAGTHLYEYYYKPPPTDFTAFFEMVKRDSIAKAKSKIHNTSPKNLFHFNPNTATASDFSQLGLSKKIITTILNYRNKGGKFFKKEDFKKIYGLTTEDYNRLVSFIDIPGKEATPAYPKKPVPELFHFNPNTATKEVFTRLGLSPKIAGNIIKYRNKGGTFRKKGDFKKIYGINPDTYDKLAPYIDLPEKIITSDNSGNTKNVSAHREKEKRKPIFIDINKSSAADWQKLKGIGKKRAARIVKFRDKLGGFGSINQVADTWGLPDSIFHAIKPHLLSSPVIRKININTVSFKELLKHPLFDYGKTQVIINYRYHHGDYHSLNDIKKAGGAFTEDDYRKIAPYLSFKPSTGESSQK